MDITASFTISPVYLEESDEYFGKWRLRKFQTDVLSAIQNRQDAILSAPTGSGKTLSLFLGESGMVGIYPSNTLLLDQFRSIDKILRDALDAEPVGTVTSKTIFGEHEIMRTYETKYKLPLNDTNRVSVIILGGKFIPNERTDNGQFIPKKDYIYRNIVERICYPRKMGDLPYIIVLSTPDTVSLLLTGIYRDFEKTGLMIHNAILSGVYGYSLDYVLSKYRVGTSSELSTLSAIKSCLLSYPWFIDEYHLYTEYESHVILPLLHVYRDYIGWENPVIFSSATPKGGLHSEITSNMKLREISSKIHSKGSSTPVRGETFVEIVRVPLSGRGVSKWFNLGFKVPNVVSMKIREIEDRVKRGENVFIIVDKLNQIPPIVDVLVNKNNLPVECSASIEIDGCDSTTRNIVVGSESISQGIDRENVTYGVISSYNWFSLIQRMGRIGRKTDSTVLILLPDNNEKYKLEELDGREVSYPTFVRAVKESYKDIDPSRMKLTKKIIDMYEMRSTLIEYTTLITYGKVSSPSDVLETVGKELGNRLDVLEHIMGEPSLIPSIMLFRRSGPTVTVVHNKKKSLTDLGTVLRNYTIKDVRLDKENDTILVEIDTTPKRYILELVKDNPHVPDDLPVYLDRMITSIDELLELGYNIVIRDSSGEEEPIYIDTTPKSIKSQPVLIMKTSKELVDYYTYTINGIRFHPPEIDTVALFI